MIRASLCLSQSFHFSTVTDNVYFTRWESVWKKNLYPSHDYVPVLLFRCTVLNSRSGKNHLNVTFHFQAWQQEAQNQRQRVHKSSWSLLNTIETAAPGWNLSSKQASFCAHWSFSKASFFKQAGKNCQQAWQLGNVNTWDWPKNLLNFNWITPPFFAIKHYEIPVFAEGIKTISINDKFAEALIANKRSRQHRFSLWKQTESNL